MISRLTRLLPLTGALAAIAFIAAVVGFGMTLSGYSQVWHPVAVLGARGVPHALGFARDKTAVLIPYSVAGLLGTALLANSVQAPVEPVLAQLLLCNVEVLVLSAVALFFSAFSTPFLTGAFTMGIWILGRSADDMATMKSKQLSESLRSLLHFLAEVLPNLQLYVPGRSLLMGTGQVGLWAYVAQSAAYGILYALLLLSFAALVFRRRDFV